MLPILYYEGKFLVTAPSTAVMTAEGNVDYNAHELFVLALGGLTTAGEPNFTTTLIRRGRLLTKESRAALSVGLPLPLNGIHYGGRNCHRHLVATTVDQPKSEGDLCGRIDD